MRPMRVRGIIPLINLFSLVSLLSVSVAYGRDLSSYRAFSLGASLADVSKLIDQRPIDATMVHERPALIQQMTWWPPRLGSGHQAETIQQVRFFFYDGTLYKMVVIYDDSSTRGLTAEDVEGSLTSQYGSPSGRRGEIKNDSGTENVLVRWEDSQYSLNLFRSSLSSHLGLVVFTKRLDARAQAAATAAVDLELREASRKERARVKAEADDLNAARDENLKTFRP